MAVNKLQPGEKKCKYCGNPFTPPKPTTIMCQHCWYAGRHHEAQRNRTLYRLRSIDGVDSATIDHTGGGCFGLAIRLTDGRFLFGTEAYQGTDGAWDTDAYVPEPGGKWALGLYADDDEGICNGALEPIRMPLTDTELIAAVRQIVKK